MCARLDREALAAQLGAQDDFEVLGATGSDRETIRLCMTLRPRVLVLGLQVAWPPGVAAIETVRMCSPGTAVVAVAPHALDRCIELNPAGAPDCCTLPNPDARCLRAALAQGAGAAFRRDIGLDDFYAAIRTVARGGRWIEPGFDPDAPTLSPLSERERAVAVRVGRGQSNREIAEQLGISEATVKKHLGHTLRKLGLSHRLQLGLCVARNPQSFKGD